MQACRMPPMQPCPPVQAAAGQFRVRRHHLQVLWLSRPGQDSDVGRRRHGVPRPCQERRMGTPASADTCRDLSRALPGRLSAEWQNARVHRLRAASHNRSYAERVRATKAIEQERQASRMDRVSSERLGLAQGGHQSCLPGELTSQRSWLAPHLASSGNQDSCKLIMSSPGIRSK
jgi:hypothetical protein